MIRPIKHPEWCAPPCLVEYDEAEGGLFNPHRGTAKAVLAEPTEITPERFAVRLYQWPGHPVRVEVEIVTPDGRMPVLITPATARAYAALLVELADQSEASP